MAYTSHLLSRFSPQLEHGFLGQNDSDPQKGTILLKQVHGNRVLCVDERWDLEKTQHADGLVTHLPGVRLGILTADCAPILFYDPKAHIIGTCHAGWRGAALGIVAEVIKEMEALGAHKHDIITTLGPTIQQKSYEVGPEFPLAILRAPHLFSGSFQASPHRKGYYLFDLPAYVREALAVCGVSSFEDIGLDTFSGPFFSRRRALSAGEPFDRQCNLSTIVMLEKT